MFEPMSCFVLKARAHPALELVSIATGVKFSNDCVVLFVQLSPKHIEIYKDVSEIVRRHQYSVVEWVGA